MFCTSFLGLQSTGQAENKWSGMEIGLLELFAIDTQLFQWLSDTQSLLINTQINYILK